MVDGGIFDFWFVIVDWRRSSIGAGHSASINQRSTIKDQKSED
jgi:hypothetical protein